jgi:hypothetical protein
MLEQARAGGLLAVPGAVVSGTAMCKPTQTSPLEVLFDGFQGAHRCRYHTSHVKC